MSDLLKNHIVGFPTRWLIISISSQSGPLEKRSLMGSQMGNTDFEYTHMFGYVDGDQKRIINESKLKTCPFIMRKFSIYIYHVYLKLVWVVSLTSNFCFSVI